MSRRTKVIITALFLVLLGIPGFYIPFTWNAAEPFEFRYIGQGAPVMHSLDPTFPEQQLYVPLFFEVRNIRPYPIHLWEMRLIGDILPRSALPGSSAGAGTGTRGSTSVDAVGPARNKEIHIGIYRALAFNASASGPLLVERPNSPIPAYGSVKVEMLVSAGTVPRIDPASVHIEYDSITATKKHGQKVYLWLEKTFGRLMPQQLGKFPQPTHHSAPLQDAALLHALPAPWPPTMLRIAPRAFVHPHHATPPPVPDAPPK